MYPDPVIGIAIEPKSQADIDKLQRSFLTKKGPTFTVKSDEEVVIISGMGELHLEVLIDRLRRDLALV